MLKQIPARSFDLSSGTNLDRSTGDRSLVIYESDATGGPSIQKLEGMEFCTKSMINNFTEKRRKSTIYRKNWHAYRNIDQRRDACAFASHYREIKRTFLHFYFYMQSLRVYEIFCVENNTLSMKTFSVFEVLTI